MLLLYAFYTRNFLFALIVVMMVLMLFTASAKPKNNLTITSGGIKLANQNIPWKDITKFWIIYQPPEVKTLPCDLSLLMPQISIPLEQQNPVQLRELLLKYVPEDLTKQEESNVDALSRILKWYDSHRYLIYSSTDRVHPCEGCD